MFHVGQQVVCIEDGWSDMVVASLTPHHPHKGCVYTIREIVPIGSWIGLRFEELINPPIVHPNYLHIEPLFGARRFRPVKTTSIEVFRKILADLPKESETV